MKFNLEKMEYVVPEVGGDEVLAKLKAASPGLQEMFQFLTYTLNSIKMHQAVLVDVRECGTIARVQCPRLSHMCKTETTISRLICHIFPACRSDIIACRYEYDGIEYGFTLASPVQSKMN